MVKQNVYILKSSGISEAAIAAYVPLYSAIVEEIIVSTDTAKAAANIIKLLNDWKSITDSSYLKELGLNSEKESAKLGQMLMQAMSSPWYKYFLAFDPTAYLQKINAKVLALNGENDIQVISKQNLPGIEAALRKSKSKVYTVKEMPGQNHLFQTCTKCTLEEYSQLEETFSPSTLTFISDWMNENVKK